MAGKPPLEGIRIADFSWVWAGPYCTLQLAYMGADVIRVESSRRPCVTRLIPPWPDNRMGLNRSGYFNQYNQGKRSLTLNYKVPRAIEVARRLVERSDVVTNNFAAGVMDKLGLGYEELKKLRPDIIMITLSGYGDTGPYRDYVAYGPAQVPLSGLSALTGYKGWPPMHSGFSYADPNAGVHGAFAVLAALYHRARTGEGQYIDMSQWECATDLVAEGLLDYEMNGREPVREGNRDHAMAPHGVFRCQDLPEPIGGMTIDMWVSVAAADEEQWVRLCRALGRPALAADPRFVNLAARKRNEDALEEIITAWTSQRSAYDAARTLQNGGVPAFICSTNKDLAEDPHLNGRKYFVELEHPEVGVRKHSGIPWKMSGTPCAVKAPAPLLGQHTDEVMTSVLGYSSEEIKELREIGALD